MTRQKTDSALATEIRSRRRATWIIVFGVLIGVSGMLWAFSIPGAVLVFVAHPIVFFGLFRGRSLRHAAYSILALLIIWFAPYASQVGNLF